MREIVDPARSPGPKSQQPRQPFLLLLSVDSQVKMQKEIWQTHGKDMKDDLSA